MLAAPIFTDSLRLRIDGVPRDLRDVVVLRHREAFAGTLPWSLEARGSAAE